MNLTSKATLKVNRKKMKVNRKVNRKKMKVNRKKMKMGGCSQQIEDCKSEGFSEAADFPLTEKFENSEDDEPVLLPYPKWDPVRLCRAVVKLSVEFDVKYDYDDDDPQHHWGRSNTITEIGFIYASTDESSIVWGLANFLIDKDGNLRPGKVVVTLGGGNGKQYAGTVLHVDLDYKLVVIKIFCKRQEVASLKWTSNISDKPTKMICLDHWYLNERLYCSMYALRYPENNTCGHRLHVVRNFLDFAAVVLDDDYSIIGVKRDACPIHPQFASVLAIEKVVELLTPVTSRCLDTCHDVDFRDS